MATLAQTVSATPPNLESDLWTISADLSDAVDYLQVESEIVRVVGNFPAQYQRATATTSVPKIRVERAAGGTTAASHADGTTLTPVIPPSAGGGAAEAGTVVEQLTGTQTIYGQFFRGDAEPTDPVPADGDYWVDTTGGPPYQLKVLNQGVWVLAPMVLKDGGGTVIGQVAIDGPTGVITASTAGATSDATVTLTPDGPLLVVAGDANATFDPSGSIVLAQGATPRVAIAADGAITLGSDPYDLNIAADHTASFRNGAITVSPALDVEINGSGSVKLNLPTSAGATGELWADAGVVKVA